MQANLDRELEPGHAVHFYVDGEDLASRVAPFLAEGLAGGGGAVLLAAARHALLLLDALEREGTSVGAAVADGRLVVADAEETLTTFVTEGRPQAPAFDEAVGGTLRALSSRCTEPRVYGEMVSLLWEAGHVEAALEVEGLWNELRHGLPFDLLCGYPARVLSGTATAGVLADVCAAHELVSGASPVDASAERSARFPRSPGSAGSARRFVADALQAWGLEGTSAIATLVVSELVTNAMAHGRSDLSVGLSRGAGAVKIAVGDAGPGEAAHRPHDPGAGGGRGLALVEAVALAWGQQEVLPLGKVVWATIATQP